MFTLHISGDGTANQTLLTTLGVVPFVYTRRVVELSRTH